MQLDLGGQEFVINENHEVKLKIFNTFDDLVWVNTTFINAISPSGNNRTISLVWNETEQLYKGYFKPLEKGQYQLTTRTKDPYYEIVPISTQVIVKDCINNDSRCHCVGNQKQEKLIF